MVCLALVFGEWEFRLVVLWLKCSMLGVDVAERGSDVKFAMAEENSV